MLFIAWYVNKSVLNFIFSEKGIQFNISKSCFVLLILLLFPCLGAFGEFISIFLKSYLLVYFPPFIFELYESTIWIPLYICY